jgi:class 3 adenylate cyclase
VRGESGLAGGEVRVRVGLKAGEPIAEDGDLFGQSVILASRIRDRAEAGQVLVLRVVADLCAGKTSSSPRWATPRSRASTSWWRLYEVRRDGPRSKPESAGAAFVRHHQSARSPSVTAVSSSP